MQKTERVIRAVIFDMDGTLIDTERIGDACWDVAGEEVGVAVSESAKRKMVGRTLPDIRRIVEDEHPEHVEQLLDRAEHHYHRMIAEEVPALMPGVTEWLEELREKQVPIALATSSRSFQAEDKLGRAGILHYFPHRVAGDQVEQGKPHPEIFLKAAALLGVDIEQCAVLEDSAPGIEAAYRSGAFALFVPEHEHVAEAGAEHAHARFSCLREARDFLNLYLNPHLES